MTDKKRLPDAIQGPEGQIQIKVTLPLEQPVTALAVICHPHSLHGGTLDNKVVYQLARSCNRMGAVSVRFNFRSVGSSDGYYDEGIGEQADLLAVIAWAKAQWPKLQLWLGGFSFGAYVALQVAEAIKPDWLITVAPPVFKFPMDQIDPIIDKWLLIQGMQDEIVAADNVLKWAQSRSAKPVIERVNDAGHFFHGQLMILNEILHEKGPLQSSQMSLKK